MDNNVLNQGTQPNMCRPLCGTDAFVTHDAKDLHYEAGGDNRESYCQKAGCEESRYQLKCSGHAEFYQFTVLVEDNAVPAYCMEKGIRPQPGKMCTSLPIRGLGNYDDFVCKEIAYISGNYYPAVDAAESLKRLGVDPNQFTMLDENDVYAIVQTALWCITGQVSIGRMTFYQCDNLAFKHPKSDILRSLVLRMITMARGYAVNRGWQGAPYIAFARYPNKIRRQQDQYVVGPFMICSCFDTAPQISIETCNNGDEKPSFVFTDCQGNPISDPGMNQEFYLLLPHDGNPQYLKMVASASGQIAEVLAFASDDGGGLKLETARHIPCKVSNFMCFSTDPSGGNRIGYPCGRPSPGPFGPDGCFPPVPGPFGPDGCPPMPGPFGPDDCFPPMPGPFGPDGCCPPMPGRFGPDGCCPPVPGPFGPDGCCPPVPGRFEPVDDCLPQPMPRLRPRRKPIGLAPAPISRSRLRSRPRPIGADDCLPALPNPFRSGNGCPPRPPVPIRPNDSSPPVPRSVRLDDCLPPKPPLPIGPDDGFPPKPPLPIGPDDCFPPKPPLPIGPDDCFPPKPPLPIGPDDGFPPRPPLPIGPGDCFPPKPPLPIGPDDGFPPRPPLPIGPDDGFPPRPPLPIGPDDGFPPRPPLPIGPDDGHKSWPAPVDAGEHKRQVEIKDSKRFVMAPVSGEATLLDAEPVGVTVRENVRTNVDENLTERRENLPRVSALENVSKETFAKQSKARYCPRIDNKK